MNDIEKMLRGAVDLSPVEVEELKVLKERIFSATKDKKEARAEFEQKVKYLTAGLPSIYWDMTWKDFVGDPTARKIVQKYVDIIETAFDCGQGFIFSGPHGTGKTALSCLIGKAAIEKGYTVKYIPIGKILDMIMQSFNDKSYKESLYTVIERVEFLIFDDLGKEYLGVRKQLNPMVQLTLDAMLRERINRQLVTIASTNLTFDAMQSQYGDSVLSILHGCCKFQEVKGSDFRLIKGKQFWEKF